MPTERGSQTPSADRGHSCCAPTTIEDGHPSRAGSGQLDVAGLDPIGGQISGVDSDQRTITADVAGGGHHFTADSGQGARAVPGAQIVEDGHRQRAGSGQCSDAILDNLVVQARLREDYHRAEKRLVLQLKSICRRRTGGKGKPADNLFKALSKSPDPETMGLFEALAAVRCPRKIYESSVVRLAKELPTGKWVEAVPGADYLSLGLMVAELEPVLGQVAGADCGQTHSAQRRLSRRQESRARYRLGLALVDGERQRKVKDKALAERMGYSPRRRAIMWNIGSCMIRASNRESGPYYALYLREKEKQLAGGIKKGHAHNRAMRYISTKFLRHFLATWNNAAAIELMPETAPQRLPLRHPAGTATMRTPIAATCTEPPRQAT